jgi:hypothetical protein
MKARIEWEVKWSKLCFTAYSFVDASYMQESDSNSTYSFRNELMKDDETRENRYIELIVLTDCLIFLWIYNFKIVLTKLEIT